MGNDVGACFLPDGIGSILSSARNSSPHWVLPQVSGFKALVCPFVGMATPPCFDSKLRGQGKGERLAHGHTTLPWEEVGLGGGWRVGERRRCYCNKRATRKYDSTFPSRTQALSDRS